MSQSKLTAYRIAWLIASVLILVSAFLPYVYERNLIAVMQDYLPRMFDIIHGFSETNLAILLSDVGFILLVVGSVLSIIYALASSGINQNTSRSRVARIWNAADLSLVGIILFSCPTILYVNGNLAKVTAFIGAQYFPTFEGFGIGYYLTWVSIIVALVAGNGLLKNARRIVTTDKTTVINVNP